MSNRRENHAKQRHSDSHSGSQRVMVSETEVQEDVQSGRPVKKTRKVNGVTMMDSQSGGVGLGNKREWIDRDAEEIEETWEETEIEMETDDETHPVAGVKVKKPKWTWPWPKQRLTRAHDVPKPSEDVFTDPFVSPPTSIPGRRAQRRSDDALRARFLREVRGRTKHFLYNATKITIEKSLNELAESKMTKARMEKLCEVVQDSVLTEESVQVYDRLGNPIFFYLSYVTQEVAVPTGSKKRRRPPNSDEEKATSRSHSFGHRFLTHYQGAVQAHASVVPPHLPISDRRHTPSRENPQPHIMPYDIIETDGKITRREERAGVVHFVQSWVQRGNTKKGLFPSSALTGSGTKIMANNEFFERTSDISLALECILKELFPHVCKRYREAFEAGVWNERDKGPFLGRAVVYKSQVAVHRDINDDGISISFPCGQYTGGEMIVPQLGLRLAYRPGDICVFYAGNIWHKVTRWEPIRAPRAELTPGRIGSVFFFPKHSYETLEGKPKGWGFDTNFGRIKHSRPAYATKGIKRGPTELVMEAEDVGMGGVVMTEVKQTMEEGDTMTGGEGTTITEEADGEGATIEVNRSTASNETWEDFALGLEGEFVIR